MTSISEVRVLLDEVMDPELSEITIADLGILRDVTIEGEKVVVTITPTYSGCPAMGQIEDDVRSVLDKAQLSFEVKTVLSPIWTTDWMSLKAKESLQKYGIAAPRQVGVAGPVECPQCGAEGTEVISVFGSTACKAMNRCLVCLEPFESFKAI